MIIIITIKFVRINSVSIAIQRIPNLILQIAIKKKKRKEIIKNSAICPSTMKGKVLELFKTKKKRKEIE